MVLRVSLALPGIFRRCREALAIHNFEPRPYGGVSVEARSATVRMTAACARFYQVHGVLLAPALFEIMPELSGDDGVWDLATARLFMELVSAKGPKWVLASWMSGDLDVLLDRRRARIKAHLEQLLTQLDAKQAEIDSLTETLRAKEETLGNLHQRHEALTRIEQGGWWRLRSHLLPVLRLRAKVVAWISSSAPKRRSSGRS
jgi:hypothetical protein